MPGEAPTDIVRALALGDTSSSHVSPVSEPELHVAMQVATASWSDTMSSKGLKIFQFTKRLLNG
ncbi:purine-cytosine transporter [Aspergillus luchuensis]|uniref:Purine-cytosine transporter n=1 Tax=Aspergillus kawachii TaxID=1069201 RepID=A0A146F5M0_ASPKA|nr:purine-cytosine transporter [Aspergillus luchuensis]